MANDLEQYRIKGGEVGDYVVIESLPEAWKKPFKAWLRGQTVMLVEYNGKKTTGVHFGDFERWATYRADGLEDPIFD